jgi:hypothetical protein
MVLPIIPQIILNKSHLAPLNTPCTTGQRPGPDMDALTSGSINRCAIPRRAFGVENHKLIRISVRCGELHGAAYTWTAVSARGAVAVGGGSAIDEAGEGGMDHRVAARVGARLETSVTNVGLAIKAELLGKIVASFVGGVCDGEWECNICET